MTIISSIKGGTGFSGYVMGLEEYRDVAKMGENIMIRELKERLGYDKNDEEEEMQKPVKVTDKQVSCIFCDGTDCIYKYMGKYICCECYEELLERV